MAPTCAAWWSATRAAISRGSTARASAVRSRCSGRDQHHGSSSGTGSCTRSERLHAPDEHDPAEKRRRDVVEMPPGDRLLGHETGGEQRRPVERRAEQRVGGDGAGDRGGGAAALAARERQPFASP